MGSPSETDGSTEPEIRQQEVIADFGQEALNTDDINQLLYDASKAVAKTLDTEYTSILKLLPSGDEAVLTQGIGWRDGLVGSATVPVVSDSQLGKTLQIEELVTVDDMRGETRFDIPELISSHDIVSSSSVIIGSVENPWGVLEMHTTDHREFTEQDAAFVQSIANILASAIEANRTRDELEEIYGRISDAFFGLDEEWQFTYLNEHAHDIINPDGRELEGKYVWDEFPAATTRKFKPKYERAMYEQETVSFEEYYPEPLGAWFEVRAYPSETGLSVYFRDVTKRKEQERKLRESEQRYRTLAESFPNGIVTLFDDDLRYTVATGRAFEYLPVASEDVENHTPREVWGETVGDVLEPAFEAALDGQEQSVEVEYSGRNWVVHVVPITDHDGEVFSGMTMAQDITERTNREEEIVNREQALRSAYEIIAEGDRSVSEQIEALLEIGRDHLETDYATFSHIHSERYEFERVAVAPGIDLKAGDTADLVELPICEQVFQTGEPLVISDVAAENPELFDPEWGIASYLGAPVVVNATAYGTFCFYDVEPRPEEFSEWDQTFVELLSDWVGSELARQQTTEQLQRQNEQLEQFANVVSHDLRNPLNVAEGRLALAQEDCDSEHLKDIKKAHTRMGALIEDLLALAREGQEVTEYTPVDLSTLINNCWATVETRKSTLVTDIERTVMADENRLKQLFENLIRNAVEHGGDDVTVTVGTFENGFYVADNGPGVPRAERDDVFDFGVSTNPDGTGFGLSIVKQIAEAHNWRIQLSEGENGGARFEITGVEFTGQ